MSETKILPCPFCGGEAFFNLTIYKDVGYCQCTKCGQHRSKLSSKELAIKEWNTRASDKQPGRKE